MQTARKKSAMNLWSGFALVCMALLLWGSAIPSMLAAMVLFAGLVVTAMGLIDYAAELRRAERQ